MTNEIIYIPTVDGDLMQVYEGRHVGKLGVRLSPETQDLFAAAPLMQDTLQRIKTEWQALGITCDCKPGGACSACEITHLLAEVSAIIPAESEVA